MRKRVSVSLHDEDLNRLESLQIRLEDEDILCMPNSSEVVRLALLVLENTDTATIEKITAYFPEYRAGRPKNRKIK